MNKILISLTGIAAFAGSCQSGESDYGNQKPNIILIMADDVAPEHFSCYGGDLPTPNIDKLAAEGMTFHRAYTPSAACTPSRYSILTGQFPGRCKEPEFTSSYSDFEPYKIAWNTPINSENLTIHELLNEVGYYTGFVGKFHIGSLSFDVPENNPDIPVIDPDMDPENPVADSLLKVYQSVIENEVKKLTGCDFTASIQWENPEEMPLKAIRRHNLEWLTQGVEEFLDDRKEEDPFFLHFNTTAFHGPNHFYDLLTPAKYTPEGIMENPYKHHPPRHTIFDRLLEMGIDTSSNQPDHIRHYNTGKLYLDDQIGAIMEMLEEKGLKENTLVILTADHAIEPGKSTCYERGLRVPFIASWPASIEKGSESNELVHFTDFLPTFAELAGYKNEFSDKVDGVSFLSALSGDGITGREYIYAEEGFTRSVSNKDFKYIAMRFPSSVIRRINAGESDIITHFGDSFQAHGLIASKYHPGYFEQDQLYDLRKDPWEQKNLAGNPEYSDILSEMRNVLSGFTSSMPAMFPVTEYKGPDSDAYSELAGKTRMKGTDEIYWWKRELDYPPLINNEN